MSRPVDPSSMRILFFGHEVGGQMQLFAETLRARGFSATAVSTNTDSRGYRNDGELFGRGKRNFVSRLLFFAWAAVHYDVFHFFWGDSLWGLWRFHNLDLPLLKVLGKRVLVHFRGLDVIDIQYFDYKRALASGTPAARPEMSRADQKARIRRWRRYADKILVSEPDLLFVSDQAVLVPQVIDLRQWTQTDPAPKTPDGIIRIVHAPSRRRKKGTEFVEAAVERLKKRGLPVELVLAEGVRHERVKDYYSGADIGIDQVLYGWHGKVAVEMMAMGLPTLCNIDPDLRRHRPDLPVVHTDPSTLEEDIAALVASPSRRASLAAAGRAYVAQYHDVQRVVDDLLQLYGMPSGAPTPDSGSS